MKSNLCVALVLLSFTSLSLAQAFPGNGGDLRLGIVVGGVQATSTSAGFSVPQTVLMRFDTTSPGGTATGAPFGLFANVVTAPPPASFPGIAGLWLDPASYVIPLLGSLGGGILPQLPSGGDHHTFFVPPGLAGVEIVVQGVALYPQPSGGFFALTEAFYLVF